MALALKGWLPDVINRLEPWMSDSDLESGSRWGSELAASLESSDYGIVCVTPENVSAPWLNFEAGAVAKSVSDSRVCPYLIGMEQTDLPAGPLTQFQARVSDDEGTKKLIADLNASLEDEGLSQTRLDRSFGRCWPDLAASLEAAQSDSSDLLTKPRRSTEEVLDEILLAVRGLQQDLNRGPTIRLTEDPETNPNVEMRLRNLLKYYQLQNSCIADMDDFQSVARTYWFPFRKHRDQREILGDEEEGRSTSPSSSDKSEESDG